MNPNDQAFKKNTYFRWSFHKISQKYKEEEEEEETHNSPNFSEKIDNIQSLVIVKQANFRNSPQNRH